MESRTQWITLGPGDSRVTGSTTLMGISAPKSKVSCPSKMIDAAEGA